MREAHGSTESLDFVDTSQKDKVTVILRENPFIDRDVPISVDRGANVYDIVYKCFNFVPDEVMVFVFIDDTLIAPEEWFSTIPQSHEIVYVAITPGDNTVVRSVAFLGIAILAAYAGPAVAAGMGLTGLGYSITAGVVSTIVGVGASLAFNALVPPPQPSKPDQPGKSEAYKISGSRNILDPGGPITRVFGKHRVYPKYAALPYTETCGTDIYYRMLFMITKGACETSAMKIGETLLTSFSNYEVSEGYKDDVIGVYSNGNDVYEDPIAVQLTKAAGWHTETTQTNTTEIVVIFSLPNGIWQQYDSGRIRPAGVTLEAQYSVAGANSWNSFAESPYKVRGKWWSAWSGSWRVSGLASGQYDVRLRRTTNDHPPPDSGKLQQVDDTYWTSLISINHDEEPFKLDDVWLIALRMKATEQLSGVIDSFNLIVEAKQDTYESGGWVGSDTKTRNPAWAYTEVLRNLPYGRSLPDSEINGADFEQWADNCTTLGFNYDKVIDSKTTVRQVLDEIAAAGRATRAWVDGKHTIVMDTEQSTPVQGFSPRNSWGYRGQRLFADLPHALICRFVDETDGAYQWTERIVYADGYDELGGSSSGNEAATVFETVDFPGITDPDHVWSLARYMLAAAKLRPEVHQIYTDVENLKCVRGQLVRLNHDVIEVGLGSARIKSIGQLGSELVTNGDMELDSDWTAVYSPTTFEQSSEQAHTGTYSWKITADGLNDGIQSAIYTTTNSVTYRYVFYVYPVGLTLVKFYRVRGSGAPDTSYTNFASLTENAWNKCECEYAEDIAGSNASFLVIANQPGTFYIDNASVKPITNASMVALDDYFTMEGGKTYAAEIRKTDGTWLDTTVTLDAGEQNEIELGSVSGLAVGDFVLFGESGSVSSDVLVSGIEPGKDLSAKLTFIDYNAAILTADTGDIPEWNPNITQPAEVNRIPPVPVIEGINLRTDRVRISNINITTIYAVVTFSIAIATDVDPYYYQVDYREIDEDSAATAESSWERLPDVPEPRRHFEAIVEDGYTYEFRMRSVSKFGATSAWATGYEYTVSFDETVPNDVGGLALTQGGSTWDGHDCEIMWSIPTDAWRIRKYQVNVYKTSPLGLLRTDMVDVGRLSIEGADMLFLEGSAYDSDDALLFEDGGELQLESSGSIHYSYTFDMNREDNGGSPISALTFRVWAISPNDVSSENYASLSVAHTAVTSVTSLVGTSFRGGINFTWDANTDPSFSHFLYRIKVADESASVWNDWLRTANNYVRYVLSADEVAAFGNDAQIYIQVKAVDILGIESGVSSVDETAGSLQIAATDIDDFGIDASKLFIKIPIVQQLTLTNNSNNGTPGSAAGYVHWSAHTIYRNGIEYTINSGSSNLKYIYWKDLDGTQSAGGDLLASADNPANESFWVMGEDWVIATNVSGIAQEVWFASANAVFGSASMMEAAVEVMNANSISGIKIDASSSLAIGSTTYGNDGIQLEYNSGNPRFYVGNGTGDPNWGDNYFLFNGSNVAIASSSANALLIKSGGGMVIESGGAMTINSGGSLDISSGGDVNINTGGAINVSGGGDIVMTPSDSSPSKIIFEDDGVGTYDIEIARDATYDAVCIYPTTDQFCQLRIGKGLAGATRRFGYVSIDASATVSMLANSVSNEYSQVVLNAGTSVTITDSQTAGNAVITIAGGATSVVQFTADEITCAGDTIPGTDNAFDLGNSSYRWQALVLAPRSSAPSGPTEGMICMANPTWRGTGTVSRPVYYNGSVWKYIADNTDV